MYTYNTGVLVESMINSSLHQIYKNIKHHSSSLCINFFHLLARKPNLENFSIYSNKSFHNFHLLQFYLSQASGKWVNAKTAYNMEYKIYYTVDLLLKCVSVLYTSINGLIYVDISQLMS